MKNQKGAIGGGVIATIAVVVSLAVVMFLSYVSAYNYGNMMDNEMIAIKENNKNIYAQGTQAVQEIAQVPGMYAEDFKAIIKQDIEGRYGSEGSKATVQFLREHDVHLDTSMYKAIQQAIESFRTEFKVNQTRMIDKRRSYMTEQGTLWKGTWLKIAGFPKINMDEFKPITTDATEEVYKRGKESGPLKLR